MRQQQVWVRRFERYRDGRHIPIRSGGEAWMNRCKRERLGRCLDGIESDKDEVVNGTDDGLVISIKGVSQLKRMRHFLQMTRDIPVSSSSASVNIRSL